MEIKKNILAVEDLERNPDLLRDLPPKERRSIAKSTTNAWLSQICSMPDGPERNRIRWAVVQLNRFLMSQFVNRYWGRAAYQDVCDAAQDAMFLATGKFDPSRGFEFSTYVCVGIKREIGRTIHKMMTSNSRCMVVEDTKDQTPMQPHEHTVDHDAMLRGLVDELLNPSQRAIIIERFGLNGEDPKTLEQVGKIVGVTKERVRQVQNNALHRLRSMMDDRAFVAPS